MSTYLRKSIPFLAALSAAVLMLGCALLTDTGSEPDAFTTIDETDATDVDEDEKEAVEIAPTDIAPIFAGFDFDVEEGAYWEYRWENISRSFDASGRSTRTEEGRFRVTLGSAISIDGILAYEVLISGNSGSAKVDRWRYLAFAEDVILGSETGGSLVVLFDARTGNWPGSGYFGSMPSDTLFQAQSGNLDNEFISGPIVMVSRSGSSGQCEYFPEVGTICGSNTQESFQQEEYFQSGVGPVGYYGFGSFSSQSGSASSETNLGLIEYSLSPVAGLDQLEVEPNDDPNRAHLIHLDSPLFGSVSDQEAGFVPASSPDLASAFPDFDLTTFRFQDWYEFMLEEPRSVTIRLEFSDNKRPTDIDVFVFDTLVNKLLGYSADNNIESGVLSEVVSVNLSPGKYFIAVWGFDTSGQIADYTLRFE